MLAEYIPPGEFQLQAKPPDPNGCVAFSFAYAINAATRGAAHPTGWGIHNATHDHVGGLELSQCAAVAIRDYELHCTTGVFTREIFEERMMSGLWIAVLIGGYRPIGASPYTGQPGGTFNHGITLIPREKVMDSLTDGRRPGIYKFHGEEYPTELVRQFASNLRLSSGGLAGGNHFEATLIPAPSLVGPIRPRVRVADPHGRFETYTVHNTGPGGVGGRLRMKGHSPRVLPHDTMIPCGLREYPVYVTDTAQVAMRQLMGGPYAGLWVVSHGVLPFSSQ